jgi:uncharacterized membrane protein YccF (DUF307 family)
VIIMAITIIGFPWARAAFSIAIYTLLPFGQKAVSRAEYFGRLHQPCLTDRGALRLPRSYRHTGGMP